MFIHELSMKTNEGAQRTIEFPDTTQRVNRNRKNGIIFFILKILRF